MKVLSVVATLIILTGCIGVITKDVKKRMLGISLTVTGMLMLANVQGGAYGFFAGMESLVFQLPTLILFLVTFGILCKKNAIKDVSGFIGFRKSHPWVLLLFLIMGGILIGIPGTGTFGAYMIEVNAILANHTVVAGQTAGELAAATGNIGVFQVISLLGMLIGIISLAIQFFDIWIHMILVDTVETIGLNKAFLTIDGILLAVLVVLGIYQTPVMAVISQLYQVMN